MLRQRYPQATCTLHEEDAAWQAAAGQRLLPRWWQPQRWRGAAMRVAAPLPQSAQMLWANMALHASADPQGLIRRWHDVLAVDGFLMFSAFGPDTLRELRALYADEGWGPPACDFTDMHDWGDMLVRNGFAEPVMDMERITLSWSDADALLAELRTLGVNLHPQRHAGLRTPRWRDRLHRRLSQVLADPAQGGRLTLTFEVVYGHAFKPAPRLAVAAHSAVSLQDMRSMLRQGRA